MKFLTPLFILAPTLALADGGQAGHAHPHGIEGAALALAVAGIGWVVWKLSR